MKPGAIVINTSRGGLIDESALADALREGRIYGAGLDVFETEPLPAGSMIAGLPNVVLTPHVAGSTQEALEATARQCRTNLPCYGRAAGPTSSIRAGPGTPPPARPSTLAERLP